jgi:hypothetical protein
LPLTTSTTVLRPFCSPLCDLLISHGLCRESYRCRRRAHPRRGSLARRHLSRQSACRCGTTLSQPGLRTEAGTARKRRARRRPSRHMSATCAIRRARRAAGGAALTSGSSARTRSGDTICACTLPLLLLPPAHGLCVSGGTRRAHSRPSWTRIRPCIARRMCSNSVRAPVCQGSFAR